MYVYNYYIEECQVILSIFMFENILHRALGKSEVMCQ